MKVSQFNRRTVLWKSLNISSVTSPMLLPTLLLLQDREVLSTGSFSFALRATQILSSPLGSPFSGTGSNFPGGTGSLNVFEFEFLYFGTGIIPYKLLQHHFNTRYVFPKVVDNLRIALGSMSPLDFPNYT
jgi:hypothetical protein